MPAARSFSMPGLIASKSTAARMTAAGFEVQHVVDLVELQVAAVLPVERDHLVADVAHELGDRVDRAGLELVEQRRHEVIDLALRLRERGAEAATRRARPSGPPPRQMRQSLFMRFLPACWLVQPRSDAFDVAGDQADDLVGAGRFGPRGRRRRLPWRRTTMRSATAKACAMTCVMMMTPMPAATHPLDGLEPAPGLLDAERGERLVEHHQLAAPMHEAVELDRLALAAGEMLDRGAQRGDAACRRPRAPSRSRPPSRGRAAPGCRGRCASVRGP